MCIRDSVWSLQPEATRLVQQHAGGGIVEGEGGGVEGEASARVAKWRAGRRAHAALRRRAPWRRRRGGTGGACVSRLYGEPRTGPYLASSHLA
eukprot:4832038-Prymnesium_polylepis.1